MSLPDRKASRETDTFYSPTGKRMQSNWWESTLLYLRDEHDLFLYVPPAEFDTTTHMVGDLIFSEDHCTRAVIPIPPPTVEEVRAQRRAAYEQEYDPVRNEEERNAFLENRAMDMTTLIAIADGIKARFPLPIESA